VAESLVEWDYWLNDWPDDPSGATGTVDRSAGEVVLG
jgi:hypothetical protein